MKEQIIEIKSKIKTYLKKRLLFYSTIIVFSIFTLTPLVEELAFVPDYFNLSQVSPKNYFRLIIGAIWDVARGNKNLEDIENALEKETLKLKVELDSIVEMN